MGKIQKGVIYGALLFVLFILVRAIMQKKTLLQAFIDTASDVGQFTTRGLRNNNPGNIRISSSQWQGKIPVERNTDKAFEQFETPEQGIRALDKLLTNYRRNGVKTIEQMISRFAPGTENDTGAYIAAVARSTGYPANVPYPEDRAAREALARAIIKHENGIDPYTVQLMARAIV